MGVYVKGLSKDQFEIIVGSVFKFPKGLIDVPEPHGDLIDKDEICSKSYQLFDDAVGMWSQDEVVSVDNIEVADTIIPAEG